jgi:hypothetical protein
MFSLLNKCGNNIMKIQVGYKLNILNIGTFAKLLKADLANEVNN